jgi:hypothetical protein
MKLTKFQRNALILIRDNPGITARHFAESMWSKSRMHEKNEMIHGRSANLCAGSHLGKLRKKGWVDIFCVLGYNTYQLTEFGEEILKVKSRWLKWNMNVKEK